MDASINAEKLETVTQFNYLGSTITDDARSVQEIKIRSAVATASLAKLKVIWRDKNISMKTRMGLIRALITLFFFSIWIWNMHGHWMRKWKSISMLSRWTAGADYSKSTTLLILPTNSELMLNYIGKHDHLLTTVKRKQFTWFGHVIRWKGSFANTMLQWYTNG